MPSPIDSLFPPPPRDQEPPKEVWRTYGDGTLLFAGFLVFAVEVVGLGTLLGTFFLRYGNHMSAPTLLVLLTAAVAFTALLVCLLTAYSVVFQLISKARDRKFAMPQPLPRERLPLQSLFPLGLQVRPPMDSSLDPDQTPPPLLGVRLPMDSWPDLGLFRTQHPSLPPPMDSWPDLGLFESHQPTKRPPMDSVTDLGQFESHQPTKRPPMDSVTDLGQFESHQPTKRPPMDSVTDLGQFESHQMPKRPPMDSVTDLGQFESHQMPKRPPMDSWMVAGQFESQQPTVRPPMDSWTDAGQFESQQPTVGPRMDSWPALGASGPQRGEGIPPTEGRVRASDFLLRALRSRNPLRRLEALDKVREDYWPQLVPKLLRMVTRDEVPAVRNKAVRAAARTIAQMSDPMERAESARVLVGVLRRAELSRGMKEGTLSLLGPATSFAVRDILQSRRDAPELCRAAIETVSRLRLLGLAPLVAEMAASQAPEVRAASLRALWRLGELPLQGTVAVLRCLQDPIDFVRIQAVRAASLLPVHEATPPLWLLLGDASWWVRVAVVNTLEALGDDGKKVLVRAASEHPDRYGREMAAGHTSFPPPRAI